MQKTEDRARRMREEEEDNGGVRKGGSWTQKQNAIDGNGSVLMKINKIK